MANIIIPTPLRKFTDNLPTLESGGRTILEVISELAGTFPELKPHLFDDNGELRNFIRIYVGDEDIKALDNEATPVDEHSVISIVPAIAGGAS